MNFEKFAAEHDLERSKSCIQKSQVGEFEMAMGIVFGEELTKYVIEYGYLAYEFIELYGINSVQMLDSDMVKQTLYLHKYFPKTENLIALENQGDGDYYLVDTHDCVFEYISETDSLTNTGLSLFQFVAKRFQEVE